MSEPTLIQSKTELPIDAIRADRRLRPVSEAGVEAILSSIDELGQIVTPLTVRQRRAGSDLVYELLDGAHRLEAARRRGLEVVPVRVSKAERRRFVAEEFDALVGLVTDESVKHGDKAVFYNRSLPLGEGDRK